jgi:hypothetical protein
MDHKYIKILFFIFIYLLGRVCMVSHITSDRECQRYIYCQLIPQNITSEITPAFQKEERAAGLVRNSDFNSSALNNNAAIKFFIPANELFYSYAFYEGSYIEPPDNL